MIKLIIFDMDGVLVDACEWHRIALNESLKEICNYEITLEEHYTIFNGIPTKTKLNILSEMGIVHVDSFEQIERLKQKKTINIINREAVERKEKIELMKFLKAKDIKIACYTNSIRMTAELMLKKTGIFTYLDLLMTNQDVSKPKPDPEGYLKTIEYFGFQTNETLIIEDSPRGFEAAQRSNAFCIKVENPDEVTIEILENRI